MGSLTILHLSDLHRDLGDEITTESLLNSLEADRDRYRADEPLVPDPDLIIVSGDLIHGVGPKADKAEEELRRQYDQAEEFLVGLTDGFVGGDRERVVIVPGNHDVSFYHAFQSMTEVPLNLTSQKGRDAAVGNARRLWSPNSPLRWSWGELRLYEVTDRDKYAERLGAFCRFYSRFYNNKRQYSLDPAEQYDVFDYPRFNVTVVGLSSCHGNDPINKQGAIHPGCISAAAREMRSPRYAGRLLLAVWHHNTSGLPSQGDYMDADTLQGLIDDGFSVGFHGHQHRPQFIDERYRFGTERKITVVSAGTLCAGARALPSGQARAYNLVQIDQDGWKGRLHQRRMQNDDFARPIWGPGVFTSSGKAHVDFVVQKPYERNRRAALTAAVGEAENLIRTNRKAEAADLLRPLKADLTARRLLLECYGHDGDPKALIEDFYPPISIGEAVQVADALWEEGDRSRLRELLDSEWVRESKEPALVQTRNRYLPRLKP